ncbi:AMP-binding protein [Hoyosella subflava]|uniref:Acyl-CoA synthetase n=1 Tax=Hoyosella subflava (strain DSM 45089 / JCM 17490 / NBRC 109087 / DQS3-9A1) TaxID=443218 RepID=F6EQ67_HOYSD|nr:AMP-binding protein [Hoyosella subflava]AEF39490.1 acyl-CoA synthetase [Hoyosella subflava DQS3-9A1]
MGSKTSLSEAIDLAKGLIPITKAGIVAPMRPDRLGKVAAAWYRFDFTPGGLIAFGARRNPDHPAVIDDAGTITYGELDATADALARSLVQKGVEPGDRIGILARNHRGFLQLIGASARLGTDLVMLNTGASSGQLVDVLREQKLVWLFLDEEFTELLPEDFSDAQVALSWADTGSSAPRDGWTTMTQLIDEAPAPKSPEAKLPARPRRGKTIVLTSGTTGTPKGARRPEPRSWMPASALLSRFPLHSKEVSFIAAPIFHTWGFATVQINLALRSTLVMQRKFSPKDTLRLVSKHRAASLFLVPTMLHRIVDLPEKDRDVDLSHLRVIAASGSAIPTGLVKRTLDELGPVLYNLYGSTEVSWAAIATPDELLDYPTTTGRAPLGTVVKILDDDGNEVPNGEVGNIFVGNGMIFEGYTREGADQEVRGNLMSTGDLGHLNDEGLLFIDGRSDDMIVSGGENVYPREVENVLSELDGVLESTVVGVDDDDFGKRLAAYVVRKEGQAGDQLDEDSIKAHVKDKLARYSIPRDVVFLEELPRNATGKVVPRDLPDPQGEEKT